MTNENIFKFLIPHDLFNQIFTRIYQILKFLKRLEQYFDIQKLFLLPFTNWSWTIQLSQCLVLLRFILNIVLPFSKWMIFVGMTHEILYCLLNTIKLEPLKQIGKIFQIHLIKFLNFGGFICEELRKLQFLLLLNLPKSLNPGVLPHQRSFVVARLPIFELI